MYRSRIITLPLVALALMGSNCEFRASTNNSVPSEESEERDREGLIVVVSNGSSNQSTTAALIKEVRRDVIVTALSTPTFVSIDPLQRQNMDPRAASDPSFEGPSAVSKPLPAVLASNVGAAVSAVPEPNAFLLYSIGVIYAATRLMRRRRGNT